LSRQFRIVCSQRIVCRQYVALCSSTPFFSPFSQPYAATVLKHAVYCCMVSNRTDSCSGVGCSGKRIVRCTKQF
jgi:hypothetical protein